MRIGIDARFWNESGVGRYIRNLVRELGKLDKENEYILFVNNKDKKNITLQTENFKFQIVGTDIHWHTLGEQMKFPSLLNEYNLDLVHFPYFSVPIFYNRPFVVTIHDLILHHHATGKATTQPKPFYYMKLQGYKFILSQAAKKSKKIITVSEATKKEIADHLAVPNEKILVTYEGADISLSKKKSQVLHEKYFLYVGNTYPHKNLDFLIRTFSEISDTKVKLKIVGREDFFQKRTKQTAKIDYMNPNIEFLSEVDDTKLALLYANALALISPSLMEGFGLPLVEAMKLSCLVIASDIPSSREICEASALYFDPKKRASLRKVLLDVLQGKIDVNKYKKLGEKRSGFFSWEKMAKETLAIYQSSL